MISEKDRITCLGFKAETGRMVMAVTAEQVEAGQAVYTKSTLRAYDFVVLIVSNQFIWKCPSRRIEEHYNRHVTANRLDVGVGTGYFLDRCQFPSQTPRVALMDLNQSVLEYASSRIARYKPETYRRNVLEPISIDAKRFDSVGINYLLHCIPGSIESKAAALDHLKALMNANAVLFGSTLLQSGVSRNWVAKRLMSAYNKKGIFSNQHDDLDGLKRALSQRFRDVLVDVVGCAAIFSGRV
jgi:2-polyprenyl-3-methyl-5-hydroxy-6-metoxy-1,4-benzoquinol methylase